MQNIDLVIASNYVRAISTAKYLAEKNNKDLYLIMQLIVKQKKKLKNCFH